VAALGATSRVSHSKRGHRRIYLSAASLEGVPGTVDFGVRPTGHGSRGASSAGLGEVLLMALEFGGDVLAEAVELAVAVHPAALRICTEDARRQPSVGACRRLSSVSRSSREPS